MTLKDNEDQKKKIILKPGEMLLYESAKVPHGRQFPLEGEYYDNILVHFGIHGTQIRPNSKLIRYIVLNYLNKSLKQAASRVV